MVIAVVVAGVLCASVGWMVITNGFELARSLRQERLHSDKALVTDCLANVDRVIDLPDDLVDLPTYDRMIDLPRLDHVIDLRDVQPRNAPVSVAASNPFIHERPSIWHPPTRSAPRSVPANA
jgi:hypothetical protein